MILELRIKNFESHEDTTVAFSEGMNLICGESNSGKCLVGETVIWDESGSKRTIYDMLEQGEWKVPSLKDSKFSMESASCIAANGNKPVFTLVTAKGREVTATANHKFFTPSGWARLDQLSKGDWVAIAKKMPIFGMNKLPSGHARLIGYMLGDGGTTFGGSPNFTNEESDVLQDCERLVFSLGEHHARRVRSGEAWTLNFSKPLEVKNRNIGESGVLAFLRGYDMWGRGHCEKSIPDALFSCGEEDIKEAIRGLLITDGWVHKRKGLKSYEVGFSTTSRELSWGLAHLLTRFGVVAILRRKKTSWTYNGEYKKGWAYAVEVTGARFIRRLGDVLGFDFPGKKAELLKVACQKCSYDRMICRYDVIPRTEKVVTLVREAIEASGKTRNEIRMEMGLHKATSLTGSRNNKSFGVTYLEKLAEATGSKELEKIVDSDIFWDKVKRIDNAGIRPTFDLEVPETSSFFANDVFTHNTSIVRALKLVAYNIFDPKAVRTGHKNCEVAVRTDKGTVKVVRGKDNIWEVTPNGGETRRFEKIGKKILPEAAEVMGLGMVTLGDIEMPVNVMDQLEAHFMLSSLSDKKATGSLRAQIIDEISGLSGIEGVIKGVSLDNHRWGREIKETEDRAREVEESMHDPDELEREGLLLDQVGGLIQDRDDSQAIRLDMQEMLQGREQASQELSRLAGELGAIPDLEAAERLLGDASEAGRVATAAAALLSDRGTTAAALERAEAEAAGMVDAEQAGIAAARAVELVERARRAIELADQMTLCSQHLVRSEGDLGTVNDEMREAFKERDEAMQDVKTCPLTGAPVGQCLAGLRSPVVDEAVAAVFRGAHDGD